MSGTLIKYGYAWKCKKCGRKIALMFCDNFEPVACLKCGGEIGRISKKEAGELNKEIDIYLTGAK